MVLQADIDQFLAFTECIDSQIAVKFIQHANQDVNVAINTYFENPNSWNDDLPEAWTEEAFHLDRSGGSDDTAFQGQHAFNIHAQGDEAMAFGSNVPTGAPSRVNTPQEEGYIGAHSAGSYFGPARQKAYNPSQWALTPSRAAVTEVWPDVNPNERCRDWNAPAFIKPLNDADLLPSLLTILGACDEIRYTLSAHTKLAYPDYGFNPDWWTGTLISPASQIDETRDRESQEIFHGQEQFFMEVQRLMIAFKNSTRSYLSAEGLTKTAQWTTRYLPGPITTSVAHFALAWQDAVQSVVESPQAKSMFGTRIGQLAAESADPEMEYSYDFDFEVPKSDITLSLYDVIDEIIWADDPKGQSSTRYFIDEAANVLVFRIKQPNASRRGLDVDAPLKLHLDRYMRQNEPLMKNLRAAMGEKGPQIEALDAAKGKLHTFTYGDKSGNVSELFAHAIGLLEDDMSRKDTRADDVVMNLALQDNSNAELLNRLRTLHQSIDDRLAALSQQQQQIFDEINRMKDSFKGGLGDIDISEHLAGTAYQYELRGASTCENTTYVLIKDDPAIDAPAQWWHIHYRSTPSFVCQPCQASEVLRAIKEDNRTAMLVYVKSEFIKTVATEKAAIPLRPGHMGDWPGALHTFIDKDNTAFYDEQKAYSEGLSNTTSGLARTSESSPPAYKDSTFAEPEHQGPFVPEVEGPQMIEGIDPQRTQWKNEW